jgi:hypothetical protein
MGQFPWLTPVQLGPRVPVLYGHFTWSHSCHTKNHEYLQTTDIGWQSVVVWSSWTPYPYPSHPWPKHHDVTHTHEQPYQWWVLRESGIYFCASCLEYKNVKQSPQGREWYGDLGASNDNTYQYSTTQRLKSLITMWLGASWPPEAVGGGHLVWWPCRCLLVALMPRKDERLA